MATTGNDLSTDIRFGGTIDPSWRRSLGELEDGVKSVDRNVNNLTNRQKQLARQIRAGIRAGRDVSDLRRDYIRLSEEIRRATADQERMNRALSRRQRIERLRGFGRSAGRMAMTGGLVAGGGLLAGTGLSLMAAAPAVNSQETAERAGLARSYGVDYNTFWGWDNIAKQMGLSGENIGDLFEEYKNKVWDYKNNEGKGDIAEIFPKLGIKEKEFAGKNNNEQMIFLFDKLLKVKDDQEAAGMADALFGGEGNKILTYMRMTGRGYQELMAEQKKLTMTTRDGIDGAIKGNMAISNLRTVFTTGMEEISGQLSGKLAPRINQVAESLAGWFKSGGIEKIEKFIFEQFIPGAIWLAKGLWQIGEVAVALANKLSWIVPDEKAQKDELVRATAQGSLSPEVLQQKANNMGQGKWYSDNILNKPDNISMLRQKWHDGSSWWSGPDESEQASWLELIDPEAAKGKMSFSGLEAFTETFRGPVKKNNPAKEKENSVALPHPGISPAIESNGAPNVGPLSVFELLGAAKPVNEKPGPVKIENSFKMHFILQQAPGDSGGIEVAKEVGKRVKSTVETNRALMFGIPGW